MPLDLEATDASKRHGERFFLYWTALWVSVLAIIVGTKYYEDFEGWQYMILGLFLFVPPVIGPLLFPGPDAAIPWQDRYTTRANLWLFIFNWISNYFWTHYFYNVLGCSYTFPGIRLNDVPVAIYFMTQSFFITYHTLANLLQRALDRNTDRFFLPPGVMRFAVVCGFSYLLAFLETLSMQSVSYYVIPDRRSMYLYGCLFYAIYFSISFPLFFRLDEQRELSKLPQKARSTAPPAPSPLRGLFSVAIDGLGATMIVTILLDAWRLFIGTIPGVVPNVTATLGAAPAVVGY